MQLSKIRMKKKSLLYLMSFENNIKILLFASFLKKQLSYFIILAKSIGNRKTQLIYISINKHIACLLKSLFYDFTHSLQSYCANYKNISIF